MNLHLVGVLPVCFWQHLCCFLVPEIGEYPAPLGDIAADVSVHRVRAKRENEGKRRGREPRIDAWAEAGAKVCVWGGARARGGGCAGAEERQGLTLKEGEERLSGNAERRMEREMAGDSCK